MRVWRRRLQKILWPDITKSLKIDGRRYPQQVMETRSKSPGALKTVLAQAKEDSEEFEDLQCAPPIKRPGKKFPDLCGGFDPLPSF